MTKNSSCLVEEDEPERTILENESMKRRHRGHHTTDNCYRNTEDRVELPKFHLLEHKTALLDGQTKGQHRCGHRR